MKYDKTITKLTAKLNRQAELVKQTQDVINALTTAKAPTANIKPFANTLNRQQQAFEGTKSTIEVLTKLNTK